MCSVKGAESLAAAGTCEVTDSELPAEGRAGSQWFGKMRSWHLCLWTLRGNCDHVGQTRDSRSARPGFKSLPCQFTSHKVWPESLHWSKPNSMKWEQQHCLCSTSHRFAGRAPWDTIHGNDFKSIKCSTCQVRLSPSFLPGHWAVECWNLLTHEGGRAGNGNSRSWREGRVLMRTNLSGFLAPSVP